MRRAAVWLGALLGGLTSLPILALLYLGEALASLPFVPFDLFDWLARVLPGGLVTAGIDTLVRLITALNLGATSVAAKRIEQAGALLLFVACGAVLGAAIVLLLRRRAWSHWQAGAIGGLVTFFLIVALELGRGWYPAEGTLLVLAVLIIGWGVVLGGILGGAQRADQPSPIATAQISRRECCGWRAHRWRSRLGAGAPSRSTRPRHGRKPAARAALAASTNTARAHRRASGAGHACRSHTQRCILSHRHQHPPAPS